MRCHVFGSSRIHDPFTHSLRTCLIVYYKCVVVIVLCILHIFKHFVFGFVAKMRNMARFAAIQTRPCTLEWKWVVPFILSQCHGGFLTLEFLVLVLRHFVYQMRCHVVHRKLLHQHHLQCGDQILVRCWQTLKQSHYDFFVFHKYLQTNKLICERLDLIDVVR